MNLAYPFSLISGNGLGVCYSSLTQVGPAIPSRDFGVLKMQSFVNVKTGNLIIFDHKLIIQEQNFPLEFYYVYNSHAQTIADIWRFAHKRFKVLPKPDQTSSAVLIEKDAHETSYQFDSKTQRWFAPYWSEGRPYFNYDKENKQWIWFDPKTQVTEIYNERGYLEERLDSRNQRTRYEYDDLQTPWRLTRIRAPGSDYYFNRRLLKDGWIESISQNCLGQVTLLRTSVFDQYGRLIRTILPAKKTEFAKHPQINFVYRSFSEVILGNLAYLDYIKQTDADASNLSLMYDTSPDFKRISSVSQAATSQSRGYKVWFSYFGRTATVETYAKVATKLYFNEHGSITQIDREQGYPGVQWSPIDSNFYIYNDQGQLASVISAAQGKQSFQYEDRDALLIKHQKAHGQVTEYVYDEASPRHHLIAEIQYVEGKAQVTRKVYDQAFSDHRGLYLRFEISPAGRVTEYRYDPELFGLNQNTIVYLEGRFPVEKFPQDVVPSLTDMAHWLSQQDLQKVSLTEYNYNKLGGQLKLSYYYETINQQGEGIKDDRVSAVHTDYSLSGDLTVYGVKHKKDQRLHWTYQEYDSARRLLLHKNAAGEITRYCYDNSHIEITRPNNLKEMTELDACEWVNKEQQTIIFNNQQVTRETIYSRNVVGNCTEKCTTPDGQFSYRFYDKQNRLGFEVNPNGRLIEYRYDAQNRNKITLAYAKALDIKKLESLGAYGSDPDVKNLLELMKEMAIDDPKNDQVSYEFYDHSGRLSYQVDAENYCRQTLYNDCDKVIAEIQYAATLKHQQLQILLKGGDWVGQPDVKCDRIQRKFYDADQQLIGTQDAAGYVTEYKHNGAGWLTEIIRYAQAQIISINTQHFDKIRPVTNSEDAHQYFFYNPRGWVVASVDAEGYITTKNYLLNGLVNRETHYANPVDATWYHYSPPVPIRSKDDQTIDYEYDVLDREISSYRSNGKTSFTHYDNMGRIIAKGEWDAGRLKIDGDSYRAKEFRFDAWGQVSAEASEINGELLAQIDANPSLKPEEKQQQKEKVWNENTRRHVYDASGLKLSTAVRSSHEASDQLTYFYYNSERQLILSLKVIDDKHVQIREFIRDTFNNVIKTREYSQVKAFLVDKFNEPLTGGFLTEALRTALDALQDDKQDVIAQKFYNKRDEVIKFIDAEGFETQQLPNAFSEITQTSFPVASKQPTLVIQHQFDVRGLEISTLRQADTLNTKVKCDYSNLYGKLTHFRDEIKGDYRRGYDRKGRLIWTQSPLQQQRSESTYDAWDRPIKITNALGQATLHLYDTRKRIETTVDPLGNKRYIFRNIFAEKIKEVDAKQQTQIWQHTADGKISFYNDALGRGYVAAYNLLGDLIEKQIIKGSKTHYSYDAIGQLIIKVQDTGSAKRQTNYHYNLLGHCIKFIDSKGIVQKNKYDRRGLIIEECFDAQEKGLNLITTREYNGQKKLLRENQGDIKESDQYSRQLDYDGLNRLYKTTIDPISAARRNALNLQTQYHKNAQNSVLAEIDAKGYVTRFIIDSAGRRCFKINALGGVTEWKYNAADQIVSERQYQQKVITGNEITPLNDETTPEQLCALLEPSAEDTLTYQFYDANGNQRFAISCNGQQGYIKEKRYDALQHEIQTIQYATGIAIQDIKKITTEQLAAQVFKIANSTQDRCHYFLRDEVGQWRFSIDPENYVCEQRFDEQGHLIEQISYANPVEDPLQLSQLPIAKVLSQIKQDKSQDRYQMFYFDGLGQPLYTVNAEGRVINYQHDAKGNLTEEVHFNQRVNVPEDYVLLLKQLQSLKPDMIQDRITQKVYDAANRLIQHTDALGYVEIHGYDAVGNRTIYTDRQQSIWKTVFDRAKRASIEITPSVAITQVTSDAFGLLTAASQITIEKHKVYDKAGNIIRIITAANSKEPRVFEAEYNGLNQWQLTRLPDISVDNATSLKLDDWRYRPETQQTLTTVRTINAKGLKVAEQDAAGHWQFWVYDQQNRLVYHVNPLGVTTKKIRDTFGKINRKIINATPCTLDLSVYTTIGIPKSVLDDYYRTRHTDADRIIDYQRDRCGRVILQHQGPVHCYVSTPQGKINEEYAEIRKVYNAWGQLIAQTEKIDSTRKKEKFYWLDRNGDRLAEVESVGLNNQTLQYRCQRFENDSFAQMLKSVAYANALTIDINTRVPFSELKNALDKIASVADRSEQFSYDKANRLIEKRRLQAIRQTLVLTKGSPTFSDSASQDLSIRYQYNANGQMIAKTLEDGSVEWSFYDQRGCKIAQTAVPRDNHALTNLIVPLSYYGYNAHGQMVVTTRFKQGAKPVKAGNIPEPVAIDPADQHDKRLYDARGKLQWKQTNQQIPHGFSYTTNGKPARQWWTLSNCQQKEGNQYETKVHLDEKYFQYDAQNRAISVEVRRDTQTVETNCTIYDAFDQAISEGETPEKMHIYRRFDQLGRIWCSNAEKGIPTLFLHDLTGLCVLRMQSATKDFGLMTYRELPNVLGWNITDVERTENQRDRAGRVITRTLPANYQVDPSQPQIIPLSILASNHYPNLGKIQSLSWPIPQEKNAIAEFSLWPKDFSAQKQTLPIVTQDGRCGVDVSALATDVYQYEALYYFTHGTEPKKLLYISSGTLQFDTGNSTNSLHLVPITEAKQTSLVRLTGNTQDISAVELWDELGKRETLELQIDPVSHTYYVDLSHHSSGVYQLKPLTQDKKPQDLSLPFTIYTHKTAHKPLSRELATSLKFSFLENHVELDWQVPRFLQSQVVKLECHYLDRKSKQQIQTLEIVPDKKRTTYADKKGNKIQSNVDFSVPIQTIEKLSLAVKWPALSKPPASTHLQQHWLMLEAQNSDSSDEEEWEMVPQHATAFLDQEPGDWIPLYNNETPSISAFDPEIITELKFVDKNLLVVNPIPDLKPDKQTPILEYLDVSLDRMRCWTQFAEVNVISSGLVVDVSGFSAGVYPFHCQESTGNLVIALGGLIFPTQDRIDPNRQHLVQPARQYSYDLWNNKLTETDSLGHTTQYIYNDANQIVQKIEPLVDAVDEQGNTKALCPITTFAYNIRGQQIARRDANGNTQGYILDAAGHKIIEILAEGTQRKTQLFDAFSNRVETRDADGQATKYFYDQENNLLAFQKPSGSRRSYTYNELKQRTSDTDPANYTRRYNFDALGNIIERYEPLGQCTYRLYGRNHQLIKVENPDESCLTWLRDAFGKPLQHTDLSGALYRYGYDYKVQLVDVMSEGGKHGDYFALQPIVYLGNLVGYAHTVKPLSGQHLHYQYISAQVTEIDDLATGKKTYFSYDSEGRRIAVTVISDKGEVLRETSSQIDALGREKLTRDNQAVFTTAYDAVSNRRFIKGIVDVGSHHLTQEVWWKYDTEGRVIISEGVFENGKIKIVQDKGMEFTYKNDRRMTETHITSVTTEKSTKMTASLFYDVDGRLISSKVDNNETSERQYDDAGRQKLYKTTTPYWFSHTYITENERLYNENGWLTANIQRSGAQGFTQSTIQTDYQDLTAMGLPQHQMINYNDRDLNTDNLDYNYVGWDNWRIDSIKGYRRNVHGQSDYSVVKNYSGPNGESCAISSAEDPDGRDKYFITTPEGLILRRMHLVEKNRYYPDVFVCNLETYYFYRVNGQYLASFKNKGSDFFDLKLNWVSPQNNAGMEMGMSIAMTEDFSNVPQTYTCGEGDTYESIAINLYGDASLGSYIDAANGGGTLIAGQTIVIPQLISVHNKSGMARPYYQLLQIIQGSFMPHLDTPQPPPADDDDFFGFLIKAIVIVVICVAAPEVAPGFVASLTATFGTAGALAVGAGLADAAAQGLCIGLGMQNNFSMAELATTMISAGFGAQLAPLAAGADSAQWMEFIVRAGAVNVEEQLAEMAIGIRQQFDLTGVALAMGSAGLSPKIKLDNPLEQRLGLDIAVAGMTSVVRGRLDVENLAIQMVSDTAGYVAHQQIKPISDDYYQSQKASRGAGHITQTTIEQQWESQLINDAEYTANTQLSSVTLGVNSEVLAQRVGEEVSHFYHPPPPLRNPSGFWRGVDDVLKMREGTMEAFSSVVSNDYQIPNDRWEAIGYSAGVPLSMGAEFIATEGVLGLKAIENVYQRSRPLFGNVTRKLEQWGIFGRNNRGELFEFTYKFKLGTDLSHFDKHGMKIANKLGFGHDYNIQQYIDDANFVIKNGIYVPELNAYVKIPAGIGTARAPFVGLDRLTNEITTFHLKPVSYLERRAPSLGWSIKSSFEVNKSLGLKQDPDWISSNIRMTP